MPDDSTTQARALVYRRLTLTFEWATGDRLVHIVRDAAKVVTRKLERGITIRAVIVLSDATTTALDLTHPSVRWRQGPPDRDVAPTRSPLPGRRQEHLTKRHTRAIEPDGPHVQVTTSKPFTGPGSKRCHNQGED